MNQDCIQSADCLFRLFRKCFAFDEWLKENCRKPRIVEITSEYFKPGMTYRQKLEEALLLEECLDQTLVDYGLKEIH